jgi:ABC-type spermidine/putrescine transport system permease subunit II
MDLGAKPFEVFRYVVPQIIRPGIIAAVLFGFTLSFDEFIRTFLVVGTQRTVPVHLWPLMVAEMSPFLPAVGVIIMGVSIAASLVAFAALRTK